MKKLSLLFTISIISLFAYAQESEDNGDVPKGEFWMGLQFGVPVGEFGDRIERKLGYGGNLGALWNPSKSSNFFQVGADLSVLYMGKDKKEVDLIPMKTTNTLLMTHAIVRFKAQTDSYFKPYVDLMVGGKWFITVTKYNNNIVSTVLEVEDNTIFGQQTNGAFSYGGSMGFSFRRSSVGVDVRILYLKGGKIEYIAPENFHQDADGIFFYEKSSLPNTDMVFPQVSVSVDL